MKILIIAALLALPRAAYSQDLNKNDLDVLAAEKGTKTEQAEYLEPVQRPDAMKIMSELSAALRLSSKQEERISAAVTKKTKAFDKLLKVFESNVAEEKKWRAKANTVRHEMAKLKRELPDTIREFLDDAQRETYDGMVLSGKHMGGDQAEGAMKPVKKKRLIRRKKQPVDESAAPAPGEEEAGQVMVDKDPAAGQGGAKKKRIMKKKAPPVEDAEEAKPAAEEEDAGAYP